MHGGRSAQALTVCAGAPTELFDDRRVGVRGVTRSCTLFSCVRRVSLPAYRFLQPGNEHWYGLSR